MGSRVEERDAPADFSFGRVCFTDNYSDELLLAHENECTRLQEEADSKRELLKTVAKWRSIDAEERELLVSRLSRSFRFGSRRLT